MSFDLHVARSIEQALDLARTHDPNAHFLAGGTDLIIQTNRGRKAPRHVIDISRLATLALMRHDGETLSIGALTTHKTIERDPFINQGLTALSEAARVVGGHQVRNIATIGGNVANASPAADVAVALLALGGRARLIGTEGTRQIALDEFFLAPGKTALRQNELISEFEVPLFRNTASAFLKAGRRKAMEISVVCVAALLTIDPENQFCLSARIALGAVAPTPARAQTAEAYLTGQPLTTERLRRAGEIAAEECKPLDDVRASADYRRILVSALVPRALEQCRLRIAQAVS